MAKVEASTMDPQARPLALELAAEGKAHFKSLLSLTDSIRLKQEIFNPVATPLAAEALRNYTNLPDLPSDPTDDDVLNYAERRERVAYDYYCSLACSVPSGGRSKIYS